MAASAIRSMAALEASGVSAWSSWLRSARRRWEVLDGMERADGGGGGLGRRLGFLEQ